MSLLTLLRAAIAGSTYEGPVLDEGDRIDNGEPFLALQIGQRSGVPLFLPYYGKCSDLATDDVYAGLQVGAYSSQQLEAFTLSACDDGDLPTDVPLVGVQMGARSGLPLFLVTCEACGGSCCFCKRGFGTYPALTITIETEGFPTVVRHYGGGTPSLCRANNFVTWGDAVFGGHGSTACSGGEWQLFFQQWYGSLDPEGNFIPIMAINIDPRFLPVPGDFLTAQNCDPFIVSWSGTWEFWTPPSAGGTDPGPFEANGFFVFQTAWAGNPVTATLTIYGS